MRTQRRFIFGSIIPFDNTGNVQGQGVRDELISHCLRYQNKSEKLERGYFVVVRVVNEEVAHEHNELLIGEHLVLQGVDLVDLVQVGIDVRQVAQFGFRVYFFRLLGDGQLLYQLHCHLLQALKLLHGQFLALCSLVVHG